MITPEQGASIQPGQTIYVRSQEHLNAQGIIRETKVLRVGRKLIHCDDGRSYAKYNGVEQNAIGYARQLYLSEDSIKDEVRFDLLITKIRSHLNYHKNITLPQLESIANILEL